jgi:hypothetical protein
VSIANHYLHPGQRPGLIAALSDGQFNSSASASQQRLEEWLKTAMTSGRDDVPGGFGTWLAEIPAASMSSLGGLGPR